MRVEQALQLMPELEVLEPLRALLLSASRTDERTRWASAGPYLTVGKRRIRAEDLRDRLDHSIGEVTAHLRELYLAVVEAMEARENGDDATAITAIRRAGGLEEEVGRLHQAKVWYETGLRLAAQLSDRGPELDLLRKLAALCRVLGVYAEAARHGQRSLALAESELDLNGMIAACEELGNITRAKGEWAGAEAWYERGLRLAAGGTSDGKRLGWLLLHLGDMARGRGDYLAAAELLARAREQMETLKDAAGMVRVLSAQGQADIARGRVAMAFGAYREALVWARREQEPAKAEVEIRIRLAELALDSGRWLEAEADLRHAEQIALAHRLPRQLVEVYTLLGRLSGRGGEETGFVFFEQALELCRTLELDAVLAADVLAAYGQFHAALGNPETSHAYLERAQETYEAAGQVLALERVRAEMAQLVPSGHR